ncbi:MAG: dihydrofolate reductase [Deltaproteobacteria bacterium]|nr:dihydrofolate reductase [Deltaproteobacteria bacterium]
MECCAFIAISIDGFIARANGAIDWLKIVERPGEDYGFGAFYADVDALVMGRKTYETALGFDAWPYTGKRCVVLTHRPATSRHGEGFFAGPPEELVAKLAREGVKRAYVDGGAVIRLFLQAGLLDSLTLSLIPVLLGEGVPLFGETGPDVAMELVSSQSFPSGLVQLRYRPLRKVKPNG